MKKIGLIPLLIFCLVIPGVPVFAYPYPASVRIGLMSYSQSESIPLSNAAVSVGYDSGGAFVPYSVFQSYNGFTVRPSGGGQAALYDGANMVAVLGEAGNLAQVRDANGGYISLGGTEYRGAMEFHGGGGVTAVNVLSMEEYLYSVVPSEMSPSFQMEALKAQAVASRSYLLTRKGAHSGQGFDLCDQGHCQHYDGVSNENAASIQAADATRGMVLTYNGEPINAVYFSSSGGVTDDSENVWNEAVPYLRGVGDTVEHEPRVWTRSFTMGEITSLLSAEGHNIGGAVSVAITRTSPAGRVQELTVNGTAGSVALTKEDIRTFFSASNGGTLESRNFSITGGNTYPPNAVGANTVINPVSAGGNIPPSAPAQTPPSNAYFSGYIAVTDGFEILSLPAASLFGVSAEGVPLPLYAPSVSDGITTASYDGYDPSGLPGEAVAGSPVPSTGAGLAVTGVSAGETVTFSGMGWGHGVGMSQCGAEGLARAGYDFYTILRHYYSGVTVE
ncbi:MAG: SpoIID/LytB domain-containing protein [Clostridiales bacterium]|jgi:stage II sporulation protein D|nr:SpoIID/LytB domain-containing protein [Clostridiales bacterium]